jgi:hypothetical protein
MFRAALMASLILMVLGGTAVAEDVQPTVSSAVASAPAGAQIRPDKDLTPGSVRSKEPDEVCRHVKERPPMPNALRAPDYEIDHLIPLCLGGSNDPSNLWPQLRRSIEKTWNGEAKDRLEHRLCEMVCQGKIEIGAAQEAFATDWIVAYEKYRHRYRRCRGAAQAEGDCVVLADLFHATWLILILIVGDHP